MGTRHLTIVISGGKTRVAQYGQWDGYPDGQGQTALTFLKTNPLGVFKTQLEKCRFATDADREEMNAYLKSLGSDNGWITMEQGRKFDQKWPYLSRDHGAKILDCIMRAEDEVLIEDQTDFAADSLMCEWVWVIDLDKNTFECFQGFNKTELDPSERFFYLTEKSEGKYKPVKFVKSWPIDDLPENADFISQINAVIETEAE